MSGIFCKLINVLGTSRQALQSDSAVCTDVMKLTFTLATVLLVMWIVIEQDISKANSTDFQCFTWVIRRLDQRYVLDLNENPCTIFAKQLTSETLTVRHPSINSFSVSPSLAQGPPSPDVDQNPALPEWSGSRSSA